MRGQMTDTMLHIDIAAEFTAERSAALTRHGQPVGGIHLHLLNEREAAYALALKLVREIDDGLETDRQHYRNRAGVLLLGLGEVVDAIRAGELAEA